MAYEEKPTKVEIVPPDPANDPRMKIIDSIVSRQREQSKNEFVPNEDLEMEFLTGKKPDKEEIKLEKGEIEEDAKDGTEKTEEISQKNENIEEESHPESEQKEDLEDDILILKVDGKEKKLTKQEAIARLQKLEAADKRLQEATEAKNEALKILSQAKARQETQPSQKDAEKPEIMDAKVKEKVKKFANAIYEASDPDEISSLLLEVMEYGSKQRGPSEDEILAKVYDEMDRRTLIDRFRAPVNEGGFKDIMDNERLRQFADMIITEKVNSGKPINWETYQEAGDEVRSLFNILTPTQNSNTESMQRKIEKKKNLDIVKGINQKAELKKDELPKTREETLAEIKSKRKVY